MNQEDREEPDLYTRAEAATRLRVSQSTIRRYGASGLIEERRVGPHLIRVTVESVERLIAAGKDAA